MLVDSHLFLWFASGDTQRMGASTLALMMSPESRLRVSVATIWELSIKYSLGRLGLPLPPVEFFPAEMARVGYDLLPIAPRHIYRMSALPLHHRDPFDRLLEAQARVEDIPILSHDEKLPLYEALGGRIVR